MTKYQVFKNELNRLLSKTQTGGGWEVKFRNEKLPPNTSAMCSFSLMNRWVTFSFDCDHNRNRSRAEVIRSAKHEFGHFVICRLEKLATLRFIDESEIDEEVENIARIFEKLF